MYYIWYHRLKNGKIIGGGVWDGWNGKGYKYKSSAVREAKKRFSDTDEFEWIVSEENPSKTKV